MSMLEKDFQSTVSRVKESFRDEVDINKIVARARAGQAITHVARGMPSFMDVSEVGDYKGALDMIRNADAFFARLPAKIREEFDNDPALFLDEVDSVEGRARFERAGLLEPIPARVPVRDADGRFAVDANKDGVADSATP